MSRDHLPGHFLLREVLAASLLLPLPLGEDWPIGLIFSQGLTVGGKCLCDTAPDIILFT